MALKIFPHDDRRHVSRRGKVSNGNAEDRNHNFVSRSSRYGATVSRPFSDITKGRQSRALKPDHDFVAILLITIDQKSEGSRGSAQVPSGPRLRHDPDRGTRRFPTLRVSRLRLLI